MTLVRWNNSYSVKVAKLDAQHKNVFEMLNGLADAMRQGHGASAIEPTLTRLMEHLRIHITEEEDLMRHTRYPGLVAHQEEHRLYQLRVEKCKADLEKTSNKDTVALLRILRDIILDHMLRVDIAYSDHFSDNGIH
jgi:hemerythrin-like metal-binding protein